MLKRALFVTVSLLYAVACTAAPQTGGLTSEVVVAELQRSGLPISDITVLTAQTDPNRLLGRPNQYIAKINWRDSRVEQGAASSVPAIESGGSIELFAREADRVGRENYIRGLAKKSVSTDYIFTSQLVLLRVSKFLTPDQADEYHRWFATL